MEKKFIITITRQFGSMGRPIAKKLAERLGVNYYDRDIVDLTAQKLKMPVSVIGDLEESVQGKFFRMKYPLGMGTSDIQDTIFEQQMKIIKELASKESCIIVGRCSDYILREFSNSIHIYIYAPKEKRYQVCLNEFKMEPDEAKKMMLEVDRARERYHKEYAGYLPSDSQYKNLMIDSSILGVDGTVDLLVQYMNLYFEQKKNLKG
ncbi:cytidylate kinase [Lachnospiraceae bacterium KM106-2]|nr:cytidylate kinase [Lachnospiraceae bacterium KM106-2]